MRPMKSFVPLCVLAIASTPSFALSPDHTEAFVIDNPDTSSSLTEAVSEPVGFANATDPAFLETSDEQQEHEQSEVDVLAEEMILKAAEAEDPALIIDNLINGTTEAERMAAQMILSAFKARSKVISEKEHEGQRFSDALKGKPRKKVSIVIIDAVPTSQVAHTPGRKVSEWLLRASWVLGSFFHFPTATIKATSWSQAFKDLHAMANKYKKIDDVEFWGHGAAGRAYIGNDVLYTSRISGLASSAGLTSNDFMPGAWWWFRTCSTGAGTTGRNFMRTLGNLLKIDIFAHDRIIGLRQNGLWQFKHSTNSFINKGNGKTAFSGNPH